MVLTSATPNTAIPAIVTNPALGIVDAKAVTADGGTDSAKAASADKAEAKLNAVSEGSGPYTLTSFNVTSQVTLTANPAYWGGAPHYGKIVIRNVEPSVQKLDVLRGESQIAVDLSPTQAQGMSGVQIVNGASPNLFFVLSNDATKVSKVTSNPDFQTAVRDGINYAGLVQLAGKGSVQAAGIIPSMFLGSPARGAGPGLRPGQGQGGAGRLRPRAPDGDHVLSQRPGGERDQLRRPGGAGAAGPGAGRHHGQAAGPVDPGSAGRLPGGHGADGPVVLGPGLPGPERLPELHAQRAGRACGPAG